MKKLPNSVSPFLMLLVPLFLLVALLALHLNQEVPREKQKASTHFQLPDLKAFVQATFK